MSEMPIYLDYMATTPVDPRVIEQMLRYLGPAAHFGNPSSATHVYGKDASLAVERARLQIADSIHASPQDLVFTSGATEADNLAILGAARFYKSKGKHLITMSTEHKAVLDSFHQLEREGYEITYLAPEPDGLLNLKKLEQALRSDTILVSVMHVNNEIGVIQDIESIGIALKGKGIIFHVDAAQSAGKLPIDLTKLSVDLMSFSAHKIYGPKGVGALYIRHKPRIRLQTLTFGGGQERGLRAGTLATHQIVGMGEAFSLAAAVGVEEQQRILKYRNQLWEGIQDLPGIHLNGHEQKRIAGNLNVTFAGLESDALLLALKDLAISTTSACISAKLQPSYVLKAIGLSDNMAQSSIRISMGRFTQQEHIDKAITIICSKIKYLFNLNSI